MNGNEKNSAGRITMIANAIPIALIPVSGITRNELWIGAGMVIIALYSLMLTGQDILAGLRGE